MRDAPTRPFLTCLLCLLGLFSVFPAAARPAQHDTLTPERQFATTLIRRAISTAQSDPPTVESLDLATRLARLAVELAPDHADILRIALGIAELAEDAATRRDMLSRLSALEPDDQVLRLARLREAMDRFQTVEERMDAYRRLLREENLTRLGRPEASRLSLDLALLARRQGDMDEFAHWLGRATAMDQAHKEAAAYAAGFFRMRVDDPFAEAELLVNLLMADPTDILSHAALARHLLDHGAYASAARIYTMSVDAFASMEQQAAHGYVADLAIAQWGAGQTDLALATLRDRQRTLDDMLRLQAWSQNPDLTPLQRASVTAGLPPTLSTLRMAIHERLGNHERVAEDLRVVIATLEETWRQLQQVGPEGERFPPALLVENLLQRAWVLLWFGPADQIERVEALIDQAQAIVPLSEAALARFTGWMHYRWGQHDEALAKLEPVMGSDVSSRLGVALVYEAMGRRQEAARLLLDVAESAEGTILGVWTKHRLTDLFEQGLPRSELVRRLDQVVQQIPNFVDRFIKDPEQLVTLRIEPLKTAYRAFEPVLLRLEISSRANYPIEIGADAALRPKVLLEPVVTIIGRPSLDRLAPIVVDFGRQLRLEPRGRLVVTIDLRQHLLGDLMDAFLLQGSNLTFKATTNFIVTDRGLLRSGIGGVTARSQLIRIDGVRTTSDWVRDTISHLETEAGARDFTRLALLGATLGLPRGTETAESRELFERARRLHLERFAQQTPVAQAWLLTTVSVGAEPLEALRQVARTNNDKLVRLSYLLHQVSRADDPMLDAAMRSDDEDLRRLGAFIRAMIQQLDARDAAR